MKRKLLTILLCLATVLPVTTFAAEDPGIQTNVSFNPNIGAYFLQHGAQSSVSALNVTETSQVTYQLDNVFGLLLYDVNIAVKKQWGSEPDQYYYDNIYPPDVTIEETATGTMLTVNSLDFATNDSYYVSIETGTDLLLDEIVATDANATISLAADSNYVPLELDIPFAGANFIVDEVGVTFVDATGVPILTAEAQEGTLVPDNRGPINLQVNAIDDVRSYALFKNSVVLTQSDNIVEFSEAETSEITLQMENSSGPALRINGIAPLYWDGYKTIFNLNSEFANNHALPSTLVISNLAYDDLRVDYTADSPSWTNISYGFLKLNVAADTTLVMDTDYHANVNLLKSSYEPGEYLSNGQYASIGVVDGYGNRIEDIMGQNPVTANIELQNINNASETYSFPLSSLRYPGLILPMTSGTFQLTLTVEGSLIPVQPYTTEIIIGDGGEPAPFDPDQNHDGKVDIFDVVIVAKSNPGKLAEMITHYHTANVAFWAR